MVKLVQNTDKSEQFDSFLKRDSNGFDYNERWSIWLAAFLRKSRQR